MTHTIPDTQQEKSLEAYIVAFLTNVFSAGQFDAQAYIKFGMPDCRLDAIQEEMGCDYVEN